MPRPLSRKDAARTKGLHEIIKSGSFATQKRAARNLIVMARTKARVQQDHWAARQAPTIRRRRLNIAAIGCRLSLHHVRHPVSYTLISMLVGSIPRAWLALLLHMFTSAI